MNITKRSNRKAGNQTPSLLIELGFKPKEVYSQVSVRNDVRTGLFWERNANRLWEIGEEAKRRFHERLKWVHPDKGGSHEETARLLTVWGKLKRSFLRHGIVLSLLLAVSAMAVDLAWNANPPAEQATYYVYQSTNVAGPFNVVTNVSTNFVTLPLPPAQYFWFVTASNYWSESGPSNVTNVPPQASNVKSLTVRK